MHAASNVHGDSLRYGPGDSHHRFRVQTFRRHETFRSWLFSKKHTLTEWQRPG